MTKPATTALAAISKDPEFVLPGTFAGEMTVHFREMNGLVVPHVRFKGCGKITPARVHGLVPVIVRALANARAGERAAEAVASERLPVPYIPPEPVKEAVNG
jgi:hypothetical protein